MAKKEGVKKQDNADNKDITSKTTSSKEPEKEQEEPISVSETNDEEADTLTADELAEWKEKYDKLNKEYLLALADFENYRKRTLREKADLIKAGGETCLKGLLPIIDDFERGLLATGKETDVSAVKEGMELIYKKFIKYLEQHGVQEIKTEKQPFDTEFHEAVTTFPAPTPEQKGQIIDCVQKGYTLNDKVIRYAKVVVGE